MTHIHLIAIQTSPGVWTITTSDMAQKFWPKYKMRCLIVEQETIDEEIKKNRIKDGLKNESERPDKLIKLMRESGREWVEDVKKENGSE